MRASLTGFYNADRNMSDFVTDCAGLAVSCNATARVDGRTYGLEALLQRSLSKRLGGWIAYTLSRAERRIGATTYLSPFDRTHVVSAVLRYDFGSGIEAGVRLAAYTGRPDIPRVNVATAAVGRAPILQLRLPAFYRLDVRAEKRWAVGTKGAFIAAVAEFFNATLTSEAIDFQCASPSQPATCHEKRVGPIALPSVGLEGGF